MVGEFPELQGIMGRYYARLEGETPDVANAIAEHYAPLGPNDQCPTAPVSVAVALADRIDTLVGFLGVDEKPTGSKDPFALRRAALGVIRLILENGLRCSLHASFETAIAGYEAQGVKLDAGAVRRDLLEFFADRLKVALREKGVRHDLVAAVFALKLAEAARGRSGAPAGAGRCARGLPRQRGRRQSPDRLQAGRQYPAHRGEEGWRRPMTPRPIPRLLHLPEEQRLVEAMSEARANGRACHRARGFRRRHGGAGAAARPGR